MPHDISPEQMDAICESIFSGRKIEAIKQYRLASREGLKEAKDFVETLTSRLREESPDKFAHAEGKGCADVVMLAVLMVGCLEFLLAK